MISLGHLIDRVQWKDKNKNPSRRDYVREVANEVYEDLWGRHTWHWRRTVGQIATVPDYTAGTVSISGTTVTGASTTFTADMVGSHIRVGTDVRDYLITGFTSTTSLTIADPYEQTASGATYTIRKKWYKLPFDFESWYQGIESQQRRIVYLLDRANFEMWFRKAQTTGTALFTVEAGVTTQDGYNVGSAAVTRNNATVTITTGTVNSNRDLYRRLRVRGFPVDFKITGVNVGGNTYTIDPVWPFDTMTGLDYQVDPVGEKMVEFYPYVNGAYSVQIWYYRKPRPLLHDYDIPEFPREYQDIWLTGVLERMGYEQLGKYEKELGRLISSDPLDRQGVLQAEPYAAARRMASNLGANYPYTNIWSDL